MHADLKPANFLIVSGELKLIDFGIAKAIQPDMTSVTRENQVTIETVIFDVKAYSNLKNKISNKRKQRNQWSIV